MKKSYFCEETLMWWYLEFCAKIIHLPKKDKLSFSIYLNESSCMKQLLGKGRAVKITKLFYGLQDLQQDTHISMRIASRVHWQ